MVPAFVFHSIIVASHYVHRQTDVHLSFFRKLILNNYTLKYTYISKMYFRLPDVKIKIISFTRCQAQIK